MTVETIAETTGTKTRTTVFSEAYFKAFNAVQSLNGPIGHDEALLNPFPPESQEAKD